MKICIISNLYKENAKGGAEKVAEIMATGLDKLGHKIVVISTHDKKQAEIKTEGKQKIYRFRPRNLFYYTDLAKHNFVMRMLWHNLDMYNLTSALMVRKILTFEKPDLVITHNLKGLGYLTPKVIQRENIKHVHVLHDVQLVNPSGLIIKNKENHWSNKNPFYTLYKFACQNLFRSPEIVISPSKWLLNFYKDNQFFPKSHFLLLRNPIHQKIAVERKNKKKNNYIFVGQLEKHKGIEWLVNNWQKKWGNLQIVGGGSLENTPNAANCTFVGPKYDKELNSLIKNSDFLILPSLCYENAPTVIPLAFQNATPVIVANIGGAAELVENEKTGFSFEPGDKSSFNKVMSQINDLSNSEYESLSQACLDKTKDLSLDEYFKKFLNTI
jgi:glycosyltransferase involved in cell wall biosynthesis